MDPLMTNEEKELFRSLLNRKSAQEYLEYGSGGSTVWACNNQNIKSVTSVEVDTSWIAAIKQQNLITCPVFFNPGYAHGSYGSPTDNTEKEKWEAYSASIDGMFDTVLVDGRFRVACAAHAYGLLKEDGLLIMHDYTEIRKEYKNIEKLYQITHKANTLIAAVKIPGQDYLALWNEFKHSGR